MPNRNNGGGATPQDAQTVNNSLSLGIATTMTNLITDAITVAVVIRIIMIQIVLQMLPSDSYMWSVSQHRASIRLCSV